MSLSVGGLRGCALYGVRVVLPGLASGWRTRGARRSSTARRPGPVAGTGGGQPWGQSWSCRQSSCCAGLIAVSVQTEGISGSYIFLSGSDSSPREGAKMSETLTLPVLPLDDDVVLPGMVVPIELSDTEVRGAIEAARNSGGLGRGPGIRSEEKARVLIVPRIGTRRLAAVGTLALIEQLGCMS